MKTPLLDHPDMPSSQTSNALMIAPTTRMKPPATPYLSAPLLAAAVVLALAAGLPLLAPEPELEGEGEPDPVKVTLRLLTGKDCVVSVRVIPVPLTQRLDVPATP